MRRLNWLVVGCWLFVVCHWSLVIGHLSFDWEWVIGNREWVIGNLCSANLSHLTKDSCLFPIPDSQFPIPNSPSSII
ncbi:MAG: hypothetical protein F6K41_01555 [Symploca sp. SIO3E6]|nr:hypothetical protein [Caldora sp. SIO3E6]